MERKLQVTRHGSNSWVKLLAGTGSMKKMILKQRKIGQARAGRTHLRNMALTTCPARGKLGTRLPTFEAPLPVAPTVVKSAITNPRLHPQLGLCCSLLLSNATAARTSSFPAAGVLEARGTLPQRNITGGQTWTQLPAKRTLEPRCRVATHRAIPGRILLK